MNVRVHLQGIVCLICGLALLGSLVGAQKGEAGTYYVATDGSDSNPGTEAQPFQTLSRGVDSLSAGDILYVKNGTYTSWGYAILPSGASWSNPIIIAAYPGHSPVIVKSAQGPHTLEFINNSYMIIDGFSIDGTGATNGIKITYSPYGIANHIRIQNSEISHAVADGIVMTSGSDGNEFVNLQVHDNGTNGFAHGIYVVSSDNIVEGCSIYDNTGWGVHVYSSLGSTNNNIIRNNEIHGNGRSGRGDGILLSSGVGNQAYDNDIWGNINGIRIDYGASDTYVGGNTIHGNAAYDIDIGAGSRNALIESNSISGSISDYGVSTRIF